MQERSIARVTREVTGFTVPDAYAGVEGAVLDTLHYGTTWVRFRITETGGDYDIIAKIQGSDDGDNWIDLRVQDETGTAHGATTVTISADSSDVFFVIPESVTNSPMVNAGYRFYRAALVNSTADAAHVGTATVVAFTK
jgi:hypothetical protein